MSWVKAAAYLLSLFSAGAWASGAYDFCVYRTAPAHSESIHARFKYRDIDPGKEAARVVVSQRYRQVDSDSVSVSDYDEKSCASPKDVVEEMTVSATPEQLSNLANAVGRGDAAGAIVIAGDVAVGATVAVVKGAGTGISQVWEGAKKAVCGLFHC